MRLICSQIQTDSESDVWPQVEVRSDEITLTETLTCMLLLHITTFIRKVTLSLKRPHVTSAQTVTFFICDKNIYVEKNMTGQFKRTFSWKVKILSSLILYVIPNLFFSFSFFFNGTQREKFWNEMIIHGVYLVIYESAHILIIKICKYYIVNLCL